MDPVFTKTVLTGAKVKVIQAINKALRVEDETLSLTKGNNEIKKAENAKGLIVGVSACATGIAHTYMAREALEKHANDVGYDVWIETQGQSGHEHKLTDEMIKKASAVVIASDINVELDRFANKKIYKTSTNEAINSPIVVLNKTIDSLSLQTRIGNNATFSSNDRGHFMKHFLNGVSYMIPFIVFSGIVLSIINAIGIGIYGKDGAPDGSTL
jgi:PTS system fructose-specific IIC component